MDRHGDNVSRNTPPGQWCVYGRMMIMFEQEKYIDMVMRANPSKDRLMVENIVSYIMDKEEDFATAADDIKRILDTSVNPVEYKVSTKILGEFDTEDELANFLIAYLTNPIKKWNNKYFSVVETIHTVSRLFDVVNELSEDGAFAYLIGHDYPFHLSFSKKLNTDDLVKTCLYLKIEYHMATTNFIVSRIF